MEHRMSLAASLSGALVLAASAIAVVIVSGGPLFGLGSAKPAVEARSERVRVVITPAAATSDPVVADSVVVVPAASSVPAVAAPATEPPVAAPAVPPVANAGSGLGRTLGGLIGAPPAPPATPEADGVPADPAATTAPVVATPAPTVPATEETTPPVVQSPAPVPPATTATTPPATDPPSDNVDNEDGVVDTSPDSCVTVVIIDGFPECQA